MQLMCSTSTGMPVHDHVVKPNTEMETVKSSCVSADGHATAFSYSCIKTATAEALYDTMGKICDKQNDVSDVYYRTTQSTQP